jgi:hypothetical protein
MCEGRAKAETEHEMAYAKYTRGAALEKEANKKTEEGIPEYGEGLPRPDWSNDRDWKKRRAGNYRDMKKRQRGD